MSKDWIINQEELNISENRKIALSFINEALNAIDTKSVVLEKVKLDGNILSVLGEDFDLSLYKKIKIIAFGKASSDAVMALEQVLGSRISGGVVIDTKKEDLKFVEGFIGSHPLPSEQNVLPGQRIFDLVNGSDKDDLIIVVSSGGGSALLCYPENEYIQGKRLYEELLSSGKTISEMNKLRKHMSLFKGGGLAKICYPASIIGLVFSDVPGNHFEDVASGPTYKDVSTKEEVQKILEENNLKDFDITETPKEDKYFEKVHNFVLVSNEIAIERLAEKAKEYGLKSYIISSEIYDDVSEAIKKICVKKEEDKYVILSAGEPKIHITKKGGSGGRNTHLSLLSLPYIDEDSLFVSFASDGVDNSDSLGAMCDINTKNKIKDLKINVKEFEENFDSYNLFKETGDLIFTGRTGANVSDLMFYIKNKNE